MTFSWSGTVVLTATIFLNGVSLTIDGAGLNIVIDGSDSNSDDASGGHATRDSNLAARGDPPTTAPPQPTAVGGDQWTPFAPDTGSGLANPSGQAAWMTLLAVALVSLAVAMGALSDARKRA